MQAPAAQVPAPAPPADAPTAPGKSRAPLIAVALLAFFFLIGGGGLAFWFFFLRSPGPGKTPEATFEAARQATINQDAGAMYDLMPPAARKSMDEQVDGIKKAVEMDSSIIQKRGLPANIRSMSAREFFVYTAKKEGGVPPQEIEKARNAKIEKVDVQGDRATLTIKHADGSTETGRLVRVDGLWYIEKF